MNAAGAGRAPVVLAGDRQLQGGAHVTGLFLVVWGGMFGGIPLAMLFLAEAPRGDGALMILLFPLLGFAAFFTGLYLVLKRKEVRLDAAGVNVEERSSFLGSSSVTPHPRNMFDRVNLHTATDTKGRTGYSIELRGAGSATVPLGGFWERNEALTAGMRAARGAGLAFEEKSEGGALLRLSVAELAEVPSAQSPADEAWWQRPSILALLAANLVPVWGVLHWGWHILSVMLLFWLENVIVGLFNIGKILLARGESGGRGLPLPFSMVGNLFVAAFFTLHYGMFCAGHGLFLVTMFGRDEPGIGRGFDMPDLPQVVLDVVLRHGLIWAVVALVASHGLSFYLHYLKPRAYEDADAGKIMFEPYKRVVILHVVIILGGFFAMGDANSILPLLLLIALKIAVDLGAHRREHAVPYEREMRDYMVEHGHRFVPEKIPSAAMEPGRRGPG